MWFILATLVFSIQRSLILVRKHFNRDGCGLFQEYSVPIYSAWRLSERLDVTGVHHLPDLNKEFNTYGEIMEWHSPPPPSLLNSKTLNKGISFKKNGIHQSSTVPENCRIWMLLWWLTVDQHLTFLYFVTCLYNVAFCFLHPVPETMWCSAQCLSRANR